MENEKDEKSHAKSARQKCLHFSGIFSLTVNENVLDEKRLGNHISQCLINQAR